MGDGAVVLPYCKPETCMLSPYMDRQSFFFELLVEQGVIVHKLL